MGEPPTQALHGRDGTSSQYPFRAWRVAKSTPCVPNAKQGLPHNENSENTNSERKKACNEGREAERDHPTGCPQLSLPPLSFASVSHRHQVSAQVVGMVQRGIQTPMPSVGVGIAF